MFGYGRPLLADLEELSEKNIVFFCRPVAFFEGGVEIARPSLTALLGRPVPLLFVFRLKV